MTYALWTVQVLLALIFGLSGGIKLVLPIEVVLQQMQLPLTGVFVRFIGVAEVLGALGLVLPGLLHMRPELTPLAAAGLATLMLGALMYTPPETDLALLLIPVVVGLLAGFVAYGRWRLAQNQISSRTVSLRTVMAIFSRFGSPRTSASAK
jgi:hypothetical protein